MLHHRLIPLLAMGALAGAGCGGDDAKTVSQAEYVTAICAATNGQEDRMDALEEKIDERLGPDATSEERKDALVEYLTEFVDATGTIADEIDDAGTPDIDNGEAAADAIRDNVEALKKAVEDTLDQARDLPTGDAEEFQAAANELMQGLADATEAVESPLAGVDVPDLEAALDAAGCGFGGDEVTAEKFAETAEEQIVPQLGEGAEVECEIPADTAIGTEFTCIGTVDGKTTSITAEITGADTLGYSVNQ